MPSAFRDPKTLAQWIELDYHQRQRWLRRWQTWLTVGTFVVGIVLVLGYMLTPSWSQSIQAGPLSTTHAMFSNDCTQCHTRPFATAQRLLNPSAITVDDSACEKCHAGPLHNQYLVLESRRCAECHHEHHGRDRLARVNDSECTSCHQDIQQHSRTGKDSPFGNVRGFPPPAHPPLKLSSDKGHPVTKNGEDRGKLFFNHKAHLNNDRVVLGGDQGTTRLLDCIDCHRTDEGRIVAGDNGKPPRFELLQEQPRVDEAGRYMQPIRYEKHCKACHPISVQLTGVFEGKDTRKAEDWFRQQALPHPGRGQTAETVRGVIQDRLFDLLREYPGLAHEGDDAGAIPGPLVDPLEPRWRWVRKNMDQAGEFVFWKAQARQVADQQFQLSGGCRLCHHMERPVNANAVPIVVPPNLPERWWVHSRFNHEPHRMMECIGCHADAPNSKETSDVLLPKDLDVCQKCHSAAARGSAVARHDCTECHQYHPHQRPDPLKPRTLDEVLSK
jgi:hypothetical protein